MQRKDGGNTPVAEDEATAKVAEVRDFIATRQLLNLASLTPDGRPLASTAPFLAADGVFCLLLSDLSEHAASLRTHPRASIMLNADECDTRQPFARLRVSFDVEAVLIRRELPLWQRRIDQMRQKFGAIIDQLIQLQDFNLFELRPGRGRYVKGFGKAYALDGLEDQVLVHLKGGNEDPDIDGSPAPE